MPGFDGTGPQGKGPMTGRGMGFCVLKDLKDTGQTKGLAGIQGIPICNMSDNLTEEKEVIKMPRGDGAGPAGLGPKTGRAAGFCAGYPVPGYMNLVGARGYFPITVPVGPYGYSQPVYGNGVPYATGRSWYGRGFPRLGFGCGYGRGRGFRGGRGRFGRW